MKRILITGGFGNLGSWLVRHFSTQQDTQLFLLARSNKEQDLTFTANFKFLECDITKLEDCKSAIGGLELDYIIHTASSNDYFIDDYANNALQVNALGTRNLLESINPGSLKNFIYFSTFHVYGKGDGTITELTPLNPSNDYAITHLFGEEYIKMFHKKKNIPYTILRLSNSYGCPTSLNSSKWYLLLNDICKSAYNENVIKLNSNGKPKRDFIWMEDVCNIVSEIVSQSEKLKNEVYNLSYGNSLTVYDIACEVQNAFSSFSGREINVEINENDKSVHVDQTVSNQKLMEKINFTFSNKIKDEAVNIFNLLKNS